MNKQHVLDEFSELVAIQSVSADENRRDEITKAASFLQKKLESLGFEVKLLSHSSNPPLVVAVRKSKVEDQISKVKTIGIYGHYDVQPEDPVEEWKTSPFTLTVKSGKIWGRGTADNKGHVIQNLAALEELITNNELKNNIVCIFEGEEETSSAYLEEYLEESRELLKDVDAFYVTDTGMHAKNEPSIFYGLRGIIYFFLEIQTGERDLHSGEYGNLVLNPINVLSDLVARIKDVHAGDILIPGFYDDLRTPNDSEQKLNDIAAKMQPSFDVHGMIGGYTGSGGKTVIPKTARCHFSFRLVEHQDPEKLIKKVEEFIKKTLPEGVTYTLSSSGKAPFYTSTDNEYIRKTAEILEESFGNKVLFNRSGGSIPVAEILQRLFKKPIILTGFTLPDDNLHAPNENFDEEMFWKGIEALKQIYSLI